MPTRHRVLSIGVLFLFVLFLHFQSYSQNYVLVGWNDLGMHCSNKNFSKVVVLPPFNNVSSQLILRSPSQSPQIVTSGFTIEYSIPNNTYSVGKTDFWTYAQQLFGLPNPLAPNIGLTGKGLTGVLDSSGNYFSAHGIPITPFADTDNVHENPFQLIHLVAKRNSDGTVLATTDAVIPVSNEVGCVQSGCHSSETSILNSHESVSGFNRNGPVLCASCHASNALGTTGIPEAQSFSFRMHDTHKDVAGSKNAITTCYKCHPGPNTQCLRDIMGKNPINPLVCQNCHGTMDTVASSISRGRRPWFDEPQCGKCHGSVYAEEPGKLFRQSKGHGGLFCSACHGSPHAILPTIQANDNIQNIRLQGYAGTLRKCSVCHDQPPNGPGPHGMLDTMNIILATPAMKSPADRSIGITKSPTLQWNVSSNAQSYELQLSADSLFTTVIIDDSTLTEPWYALITLDGNQQYFWRVNAKGQSAHSPWSNPWSFTTANGTTMAFAMNKLWNIVSLPMTVENPAMTSIFPSALSQAFAFNPLVGYQAKDTIVIGSGYWLRFGNAEAVSITGTPLTSDTIDVMEGWNLIGSIADSVPVSAIRTIPDGIIASAVFGYNTGYFTTGAIVPPNGYWVKVNGAGKIILAHSPLAKQNSQSIAEQSAGWDKILFRDAMGRKQTLYLSDQIESGVPISYYGMPPLPPEGSFDVRFASDRFLEKYARNATRKYGIRISSAAYPVMIEWQTQHGSLFSSIELDGSSTPITPNGSTVIDKQPEYIAVTVSGKSRTPEQFILDQNYPNPFNPATVISYQLPERSYVQLKIYNLLGEEIATLVNGIQEAGHKSVPFDATHLSSGLYLYKLNAGIFSDVKKMVLIK
jgi:hypothetical protein